MNKYKYQIGDIIELKWIKEELNPFPNGPSPYYGIILNRKKDNEWNYLIYLFKSSYSIYWPEEYIKKAINS